MAFISEDSLEQLLMEQLRGLGYAAMHAHEVGPDAPDPQRHSHSEAILLPRLRAAVQRLNPELPKQARQDAIDQVMHAALPSLTEENRRLHRMMVEGVGVEYRDRDGNVQGGLVQLLDFANPQDNDLLALRQFTVVAGRRHRRRADLVVFVNGLPLAVVELKRPGLEDWLEKGHIGLQTYKAEVPQLFRTNAMLVVSDGVHARIGSLTAQQERFMPWRTTDGDGIAPKGEAELEVLVEGVFAPQRLMDLLANFTVFAGDGGHNKILAGYHQYHAVNRALESTIRASREIQGQARPECAREDPAQYGMPGVEQQPEGDRRAGVIWHTQGSGKSLLMAFYAGKLIKSRAMRNPTLVVLTDRNDLDEQLFTTFCGCSDLLRQTPERAESRDDLKKRLARKSGGVVFTTLQKFGEPQGPLTERNNVVVIADEAHRSQYGFKARLDKKSGRLSYGLARYMRDSLPGASFIGFTGTPIERDDVSTPRVFGNYIDIYDISRAVEDEATVPIYYESRLARLQLDDGEQKNIDTEVAALTGHYPDDEQERLKRKWASVKALVGSERRLAMVARDMVEHLERRLELLDGKAMAVCMSRHICVALHDKIVQLRPHWHDDDDDRGAVKVVMTGQASDAPGWQQHIRTSRGRERMAQRARDPDDPLRLVLVCDMWLTGFDAPCMHTLYVDKPMHGYSLMQAIARVNRVFRDKQAGLVVDYIGVAQDLKNALGHYTGRDQKHTGIDQNLALQALQERYEVVRAIFHGFGDYMTELQGDSAARLRLLARAAEWVLAAQRKAAEQQQSEDGKKRAHRRYQDEVLALSRAFALAAAFDEAQQLRDEVAFFQAVRELLVGQRKKGGGDTGRREHERAIQQLISRAVVSTEIVDILAAAGLQTRNIAILSDEFLQEMQHLKYKNLALEVLRRLLAGQIRSRSRVNVVETRDFSERLQAAMARYHSNAISTVEALQQLIELAREVRQAAERGEKQGLSDEELAFYDALADNRSAVEKMGDKKLLLIAHELVEQLRKNHNLDWARRESARAKMRLLVKRILDKYGYPPDLQDAAVQTVLQQAEAQAASWDQDARLGPAA